MWKSCSRYLNIILGASRPFTRKSANCYMYLPNNHMVRCKPTPKFQIDPRYLIAISLPFLWKKSSDNQTINDKRHFRKIIKIIKAGKVKEYYKEYDEAEIMYHKALEALDRLITKGIPSDIEISQTRSYILDCLANLFLSTKDFEKAETLFKEVLKELIFNQKFETDDNAVVEISLKLAIIYTSQKKFENARIGYQFCIDTMENKLSKLEDYMNQADKDSLAMYGLVSDAYSKFLIHQQKWNEALPHLQKSLLIAKKVYEDAHPQVAVISNDLGVAFTHLDMLEDALEHFEFAIEICKQCGSSDLPAILYNLGDLFKKMDDPDRASGMYKSALDSCNEETSEEIRDKILLALKSMAPS